MKQLKLAKKNKDVNARSWEMLYEKLIEKKIRAKYSVNAELAILRQKDIKRIEFEEYNKFVEECKAAVKAELGI